MITRHHRKPKCQGVDNSRENISRVPHTKHKAYHLLFQSGNPFKVARILNRVWIDRDYKLIVVRRLK